MDITRLKGVSTVGEALLSDQLEINLSSFFNWGLLGCGGFFNVHIPASGSYGGNQERLRLSEDPNYTKGRVWEGFRKDWVWETGVEYPVQPIRVSGVYINGNFQPATGVGAYAHHINYPLGQVVFDTAISASSTVKCEYSYRQFQISTADVPWFREIQQESFRIDDRQFLQYGSGNWSIPAANRLQLPAVVVEAVPHTSRYGLEIGSCAARTNQDVLFHIFAETRSDKKFLHDAITYQWQKRLVGFDKNLLWSNNAFPLDHQGSPRAGANMYPDFVKPTGEGGYGWRQIRCENMRSTDQTKIGDIQYCTVRGTFQVDLP